MAINLEKAEEAISQLRAELAAKTEECLVARESLWLLYPDPMGAKYGDDGEMQSSGIDFKRQPIKELSMILAAAVGKEYSALRKECGSLRAELHEARAEVERLRKELAHVGEGSGCCDHWCLCDPPKVGTNAGKCYCSQGKVRRYINELRAERDALKTEVERLKPLPPTKAKHK